MIRLAAPLGVVTGRVGEDDVAGLEVAVEEAAGVGVLQCVSDLCADARDVGRGERALAMRDSRVPPVTSSITRKSTPPWESKS